MGEDATYAGDELLERTDPTTVLEEPNVSKAEPGIAFHPRIESMLPLFVALIAGVLFFMRLGALEDLIPQDEAFYVPNARSILAHGSEAHFVGQPPVGKWFIAAGIALFGDKPLGWRAGSALFGALGVMIVYLLARRLWSSTTWALIAALLLTFEGLWFVQSRIGMLEIYMATFVLIGIMCLLEDRARACVDRRGPRWFRLSSGLSFGLALGTKWTSIPFLLVAASIALVWAADSLRDSDRFRIAFARQALAITGTFIVVPLLVYMATYIPWLMADKRFVAPECSSTANAVSEWFCSQRLIFEKHGRAGKLDPVVPGGPIQEYVSDAWSWPWIGRPVHHSQLEGRQLGPNGQPVPRIADLVGLPNPLIWLPAFFIAIPVLAWRSARKRDGTAGFLLAFIAAGYVPFVVGSLLGKPAFLYYMTPVVPLLVLAVVYVLRAFEQNRTPGTIGWYYVLACVAAFSYFYPVLASSPLPPSGGLGSWDGHMWLTLDCSSSGVRNFCWR
jgi:dolichyl-phosphate-mannose--protein O-mannosyl transferase